MRSTQRHRRACARAILAASAAGFGGLAGIGGVVQPAHGSSLYWDLNGSDPGAGFFPNASWGPISPNWNPDPAGTAPVSIPWQNHDIAVFSAGSDLVAGFAVQVSAGAMLVAGIVFEEGTPTVSGGGFVTLSDAPGGGPFGFIDTATASATINCLLDGSVGLTKTGAGTLTLGGIHDGNLYTGDTTVNAGTLRLMRDLTNSSAVHVNSATLQLTRDAFHAPVIKTPAVTVTGTGKIDLTDRVLIVTTPGQSGTFTAGAYTAVAGLVDTGRGSAGNAQWDGTSGITTTDTRAINNGDLVSIGVAKVSDVRSVSDIETTTFAGQTVTGADTIAMVTWGGDANLDGKINIDDYGRIDGNVGQSGSVFGWSKGDFNYDGKINIDDYGIIDGNVNRQGTPFAVAASATSAALEGASAVPEPSLLPLAALALLARRRRHGPSREP